MAGKMYIYDAMTEEDRDQARARVRQNPNMTVLGVTSKQHWIAEMDRLVAERPIFDRVLVQTHGAPGKLSIGSGSIYDTTLRDDFAGRRYHTLFPTYTRFYYDGCNVAEGSMGTDFLDMTATIFLKTGGGEVFGWENYGYAMPWWLPFLGGHTIHNLDGNLKKFFYRAGPVKYTPPREPYQKPERMERGFKI